MTGFWRLIVQEVVLSAILAAGSVIGLPKLANPNASADYPLAAVVFLAMSAALVTYELLTRKPS
ncbi:hypothetical protein [Rhizobium sp. CNPSo 3490]|uniref:hypothetical protein n=1 Tax=Rhizobium sp. CNPSo 3490 TaxID=3021407 RepID=UPI00254C8BE2|nr:hypothetical protein [Rhizobium sp. CNPSo 3490]MDK4734361.1 hypothetical protein [Rhizobium sp. CNPSo 3490]